MPSLATDSERGQARRLVKETYDWFTEGHETVDLRAARGLLATPVARQVGDDQHGEDDVRIG